MMKAIKIIIFILGFCMILVANAIVTFSLDIGINTPLVPIWAAIYFAYYKIMSKKFLKWS